MNIILYKDAGRKRVRPIGIGESLRRLVLRCLAQQERGAWAEWFTSILPEREAERQVAIAEAQEEEEEAGSASPIATATRLKHARLQPLTELPKTRSRRRASAPTTPPTTSATPMVSRW